MKREKKAKQDHGTVFSTLCMVLFGAALGIFAGKDLFEIVEGVSFGEYLLHVAWLIVMMTAAFYLQTILHEGGHLVCGLLTGYRFVSFRIGSWMVQRENGRLRFHRYTLAGTAGQCLLAPPELTNGKMPYKLYNLGGVLANLLAAALAGALGGILLASQVGVALPTCGIGSDMDVIASVVLGGVSLSGGCGKVSGTLLGALILQTISNGMTLLSVQSYWQMVIKGIVLILAVLIDVMRSKKR